MRHHRWKVHLGIAPSLLVLLLAGCRGGASGNRVASAEPPLVTSPGSDKTIVQAEPSSSTAFVDRHPLFAAPRDMYNNTQGNKVVKSAAGAVVGVPVGLYGELKQIVVGSPNSPRGGY